MNSEYQEQKIVVDYLKLKYPKVLFTATANGIRTPHIGARMKMKRAGLKAGVPDLLIFNLSYDRKYIGLALEMKREKNCVVSQEQKEWLDALSKLGWLALIAKGANQAMKIIDEYLKGEKESEKH